jgi:hypothetical protein
MKTPEIGDIILPADEPGRGTPGCNGCQSPEIVELDGLSRSVRAAARMAALLGLLALCFTASLYGQATSLEENFAENPAAHGWRTAGEASLFLWNAAEQRLEVTWDSSRPNSYFYRQLSTVLSKRDDFSLEFDVSLAAVEIGVTPEKPFTFQLAIGYLNIADSLQTNFLRGSGVNPVTGPRNVVEFDYFPDSGFGATVSPTIISTNNMFASSFSFPLELSAGPSFHVSMRYSAADQTLRTSMTRDGEPFGPVKDVVLTANFSDFRVDTLSINSFSDSGADGSLRARGAVDNVIAEFPGPPIMQIAGAFLGDDWQVSFATRTNWMYTLEASEDVREWTAVKVRVAGTGNGLTLTDDAVVPPTPSTDGADMTWKTRQRFYRVRAERL